MDYFIRNAGRNKQRAIKAGGFGLIVIRLVLSTFTTFILVHLSLPDIEHNIVDTPLNDSYFGEGSSGADPDWLKFPYPLSCPHKRNKNAKILAAQASGQKFNVVLAYHVGMVGEHWEAIVKDQLQTIAECSLGGMITRSIVSYGGDNDKISTLLELFRPYSFLRNITQETLIKAKEMPWEVEAMNAIHRHCASEFEEISTVVFYVHNKGSSKLQKHYSTASKACVQADWRIEIARHNRTFTYGHSLYWRKYMEYFTIERPELCIDKIIGEGYPACGVNLKDYGRVKKNHFSGNIWVASCEYIRTLTPLERDKTPSKNLYTLAEMWIGTKWDEYLGGDMIEEKHAREGILNHTRIRPYSFHQLVDSRLYKRLIRPEEYWLSSPPTIPPIVVNELAPNYHKYYWKDLPDNAKDSARLLGYDEHKWDNDEDIAILGSYLEDLSKAEHEAITLLGLEDYFTDRCYL